MSEKKYYVICDDDCLFEGMTNEQIFAAITDATGNTPSGASEAFISAIKESNANKSLSFWLGNETQFAALGVSANCVRLKVDANGKLYVLQNEKITEDEIDDGAVSKEFTTALPVSGWTQVSDYLEYTASVNGLLAKDRLVVDVNLSEETNASDMEDLTDAMSVLLRARCNVDGKIIFTVSDVPSVSVPLKILAIRK